jgi:hypothetical protein
MLRYEIINKDEIPEDLKPGKYCTKIVDTSYCGNERIIRVKFLNIPYDEKDPQCAIVMTKS